MIGEVDTNLTALPRMLLKKRGQHLLVVKPPKKRQGNTPKRAPYEATHIRNTGHYWSLLPAVLKARKSKICWLKITYQTKLTEKPSFLGSAMFGLQSFLLTHYTLSGGKAAILVHCSKLCHGARDLRDSRTQHQQTENLTELAEKQIQQLERARTENLRFFTKQSQDYAENPNPN